METLIISLVLGIISGLIASYMFLMLYLKKKRPVIEISNYISKIEYGGETNYLFKFINKTDSEIFDVRMEPTFYKPVGDFNGRNLIGKDITLKDNFSAYIPCDNEKDTHNLHAMRIRTTDDLEKDWTDESSFIRLTIIAKHSLSGLNKVFVKDFLSKDCITIKKFLSGNDLKVS
ncbi:MAG: hypothetical protein PHC28_06335 [Flavobacterium sp.]|uniref:hypothetical protein n=1 Tax=Flavobacterium sp. TaxID=239 RepID=UPI00262ED6C8|nr:hypothetical protein [Flavobacterium sp.]MDD5150088.1 hypothetical protein [Flavobacterium sp.]